jgi:hypothetical protein
MHAGEDWADPPAGHYASCRPDDAFTRRVVALRRASPSTNLGVVETRLDLCQIGFDPR